MSRRLVEHVLYISCFEPIPLSRISVFLVESLKSIYFKHLPTYSTTSPLRIIRIPTRHTNTQQPACHHTINQASSRHHPIAHQQSTPKNQRSPLAKCHLHLHLSRQVHVHSSVLSPSVYVSAREAVPEQMHPESEPNRRWSYHPSNSLQHDHSRPVTSRNLHQRKLLPKRSDQVFKRTAELQLVPAIRGADGTQTTGSSTVSLSGILPGRLLSVESRNRRLRRGLCSSLGTGWLRWTVCCP